MEAVLSSSDSMNSLLLESESVICQSSLLSPQEKNTVNDMRTMIEELTAHSSGISCNINELHASISSLDTFKPVK